jgi:hypothetical protein
MLLYRQHTSRNLKPRSDFRLWEDIMGRQTDLERLQRISECVEQHPGVRPAEIAKALDVPRSCVIRT